MSKQRFRLSSPSIESGARWVPSANGLRLGWVDFDAAPFARRLVDMASNNPGLRPIRVAHLALSGAIAYRRAATSELTKP